MTFIVFVEYKIVPRVEQLEVMIKKANVLNKPKTRLVVFEWIFKRKPMPDMISYD